MAQTERTIMWSTWNGIIRKFNREIKKKDVVETLNDMDTV